MRWRRDQRGLPTSLYQRAAYNRIAHEPSHNARRDLRSSATIAHGQVQHHILDRMSPVAQSEPSSASGQLMALGHRLKDREGGIPLGEVVDGLGRTGIGMTLLLLSLPALIPIPGPFGLVFGSVVAVVSMQLMFGARRLILPNVIRARELPATAIKAMVDKGVPLLQRAERWLKPRRLLPLTGVLGRMALGLPLMVMGIAVALPVPTGNVPPVASLIVLSLGLMMRDGAAIVVGLVLAVLALSWFAFLFTFGAQVLDWLWFRIDWS